MQMQICGDGVFRRSPPCQRIHLPRRENFLEVSSLSTECQRQTSHLANNLSLAEHFHAQLTLNSEATQKHCNNSTTLVSIFKEQLCVKERIYKFALLSKNGSCYFLEVIANYPSNSRGWEEAL